MTSILLVDDHAVVRAGLRAILESREKPITVEEASCFEEALAKVRQRSWDAMILDVSLPGKSGLEILKQIKKEYPSLPVLMLSIHPDRDYGVRALRAGASGCLEKSAAPELLLDALERILAGRRYVSPELSEILVAQLAGENPQDLHEILTDREFEIFRLVAAGNSTSEIARKLSISAKTVHSHRRNILKKLDLKSNTDVVRYAFQHGLVE
ncbi:MAG: response regulator transcription factor [Rhodothermales bacterium]|nr:response regulator transcription factor [Rhodothermales bacterium]